jgi:transposase
MLTDQLHQLEGLIERYAVRIEEMIRPFAQAEERLMTIPGVGRQAAEVIVAEVGADMSRFPTAGHLASWAGLCPGNNTSADKRKSGRTTKGSQWRHFLNDDVRKGLSVDNSRRDVCNRGRDSSIGLDGASPHAHDPATHRQRLRGPLRSIRRRHRDGQGP